MANKNRIGSSLFRHQQYLETTLICAIDDKLGLSSETVLTVKAEIVHEVRVSNFVIRRKTKKSRNRKGCKS